MKKYRRFLSVIAMLIMVICPVQSAFAAIPSAPSSFKVTARSTTATLSWKASANAAKYEIYELKKSGKTDKAVWVGSTKSTSMVVKNMKPQTEYRFVVRAVDANGKAGAWSREVSAKTTAAIAGTSVTVEYKSKSAVVKWDSVKEAAKYQVYRVDDKGNKRYLGSVSAPSTTFTHKTGEKYRYGVVVISKYGDEGLMGLQKNSEYVDTKKDSTRTAYAGEIRRAG